MTIAELKKRWRAPEYAALVEPIRAWLEAGGEVPAGVGIVADRVDLRGFPFPLPTVSEPRTEGLVRTLTLSGVPEMRGGRWELIDFSYARLQSMRFFDFEIDGCLFEGASCGDWRLWSTGVSNASFDSADLRHSALGTGQKPRGNRWIRVSFSGTDLRGAFFHGATLDACVFRHAKTKGLDLTRNTILNCGFVGVMEGVKIDNRPYEGEPDPGPVMNSDFSEALFRDVDITGCHFVDVTWPAETDVFVFDHFQAVARRALELIRDDDSERAQGVNAILRNSLRGPHDETAHGVFSRDDVESWGGSDLAEFMGSTLRAASREVNGA